MPNNQDNLIKSVEANKILLAEIKTDIVYIKEFIASADNRYASKVAEKLVYGLVGIILIGVTTALLAGVVKATEYLIK